MNQHPDPAFDQRVADWLEEDLRAPAQMLEMVLAAIPSIPQRRSVLPRNNVPTIRFALLAAAIVALMVLGIAAVAGSFLNQSPLPSGPPSPLPSMTEPLVINGLIAIGKDEAILLVDPITGETVQSLAVPSPLVTSISWAPDGERLVFAVEGAVWVTNISNGASKEIYGCGTGPAGCEVAWSPDGSRIAVTQGHRLMLVDPDGGNEGMLEAFADWAFHPAWSPDGSRIAVLVADIENPDQGGQIVAVDRDGADVEVLLGPGPDVGSPSWSPDGSTIAYLAGTDAEVCQPGSADEAEQCDPVTRLRITAFGVDGSGPRDLRPAGDCMCLGVGPSLTWSPDGTSLAVVMPEDVVAPTGGDFALFVISADGREIRQVLVGHAWSPAWQPIH
jgi:WD40 repeat protein